MPNVTKVQLNNILKTRMKDAKIENIIKNKQNLIIIQPSDIVTFNNLVKTFPKDAFAEKDSVKVYVPNNIKNILDTEKVVFIKYVDLDFSIQEIQEALTSHGFQLENVERVYLKKENKPTKTIKVVFDDKLNRDTCLKTGLKIDYLHFSAEAAQPNKEHLQCFKCFKYEHPSKYRQKQEETCKKCVGQHLEKDCTSSKLKCVNCDQQHASNSKQCPDYLKNKEKIQKTIDEYTTELNRTHDMCGDDFSQLTSTRWSNKLFFCGSSSCREDGKNV
ncbi:unnamed protein product [Didymodactylos carnosus]|uniref:Pre-C2HC domain-containing protein n=1 Tax=Didymodactylos carnosus TaxID=1234261 RepID=A0A813WB92_9BILA|nr:unnamed protein product [Didymodactylos carnosus]CAF1020655.1 unnamed protein product [Didymodactylos carnosus]CAF3642797.1 unnamed protein product [Didymodactylos carnosus]CAF3789373.1 unnamed protein product [Didymodactylos carnosus]